MTNDTFTKLAPAWARTILDEHHGFLTEATLPELAKAWPDARVLVRCHSYRFTVTADQAEAAIAQQGDQLRDASLLAGFWTEALKHRALGDTTPPRTTAHYLMDQARQYASAATDATSERNAAECRTIAETYREAAKIAASMTA